MNQNGFPQKTIRKNKPAAPGSSGQIRKMDNFKTALGMGANWYDMDTQTLYHIQEYSEKLHDPTIPRDQKPTKIKMTKLDGTLIGYADEWMVRERMKDPEPDPRY